MQRKLLVALQLKVPHRFIERPASGRARRVKDPGAFGATPTPKTGMFDPYELTQSRHLQTEDKISAYDVSFHFYLLLLAYPRIIQCI